VETNVTIIKGTGGAYPLITPRSTTPNGIATPQPLPAKIIVYYLSQKCHLVNKHW
jgi:hypothetical protein